MKTADFVLALDLLTSLGARMTAVVNAISAARADGRTDLSPAELEQFRQADDRSRDELERKIAAARAREAGGP